MPSQLHNVLQALSTARSVSELAAQHSALAARRDELAMGKAPQQLVAAACNALRIVAAVRTLPTTDHDPASSTLRRALSCASELAQPACKVLAVPMLMPSPSVHLVADIKDLMLAVAEAAKTVTTHLHAPPQAGSLLQVAPLHVWIITSALLEAAASLDDMLARGSVPAEFAAEVAAMSSALPGLAVATLCSVPSGQHNLTVVWAAALRCARDPIHKAFCTISSSLSLQESVQGDLAELVLLRLGLQAAALHQQQEGRSCSIPADPVAAAGLSSSSSSSISSSVGGSSGQSRPAPTRLVVPALHTGLLRRVPHAALMLQQPDVMEELLPGRDSFQCVLSTIAALSKHAGGQVCRSSVVTPLQVLLELAALRADSPELVCGAVDAMMLLALSPAASSSGRHAARNASSGQCTPPQLQPAHAAGLLAPVLHLLSAAVLHVLGPPAAGGAVRAAGPLASDVAGSFAVLVAAVVVPVEPKHLAAAICRQPLRSLAALEMTLRLMAADLVPQLSEAVRAGAGAVSADGTPLVLKLAETVAGACSFAVQSGKLETALQGSDSATASLVSNHLLALLASCLKCWSRAAGDSNEEKRFGAVVTAKAVAHTALRVTVFTGLPRQETASSTTSSSSSSQATISCCGTTHWLSLAGHALTEFGQQLMQFEASRLLHRTIGVRARLGLQEGEVPLASAADAAAVIRAAARAATGPGGAGPQGRSHGTAQREVDVAAAAIAGGGLMSLCGDITSPDDTADTGASVLSETLCLLHDSLAQLAQQQQQQQEEEAAAAHSSGASSQVQLLQQLAHAAADVQQQLDSYCSRAALAASCCYLQGSSDAPTSDAAVAYFGVVVAQGCDGVTVLRDAQGQPIVKQHALLNVLHHAQRLQCLGAAVCAVLPPLSLACANPACGNVSGLSDMHLVWRRGVCGHCREARFCSAACLRAHWAAHRDPGSLVAAVLGGGGGGGVGAGGAPHR